MDERLRRVLDARVADYLAGVERILAGPAPTTSWAALRERLRPLVTGWRLLLATHEPDRCRLCARGWRRRAVSCSVWRTAGAVFVARLPGE